MRRYDRTPTPWGLRLRCWLRVARRCRRGAEVTASSPVGVFYALALSRLTFLTRRIPDRPDGGEGGGPRPITRRPPHAATNLYSRAATGSGATSGDPTDFAAEPPRHGRVRRVVAVRGGVIGAVRILGPRHQPSHRRGRPTRRSTSRSRPGQRPALVTCPPPVSWRVRRTSPVKGRMPTAPPAR